ncbi:uncharacterized protein [Rhodnius prolixus]|uniref:Chitin-binding type-2 domain-containing protein n=1 Tax=Rhodnius prolixus TaxID=13249 RepID=T1HFZ2_RHOPR
MCRNIIMYANFIFALFASTELLIVHAEMMPRCPPEGSMLLPVPGDCSGYIVCQDGYGVYENCNMLKLFDRVINKCEWRWKIDCGAVPIQFPPTSWKSDP